MLSATLTLALSSSNDDLQKGSLLLRLPKWALNGMLFFLSAFITRQIRHLAQDVSMNVLRIVELSQLVSSREDGDELLDQDGELSGFLINMQVGIKGMHRRSLGIIDRASHLKHGKDMVVAARQLAAVFAECHDAIANLAWEVSEHDASRAPRKDGFVASTPDEVEAMLARISAGE